MHLSDVSKSGFSLDLFPACWAMVVFQTGIEWRAVGSAGFLTKNDFLFSE